VIFAALRSLLTRRANSSRCFTPQNPSNRRTDHRQETLHESLRSALPVGSVNQICNLTHKLSFLRIAKVQEIIEVSP
jgi:hypothetical protein